MAAVPLGFDIDAPRWDQSTFMGRLRHFLNITDPRTVLVPERELDRAQAVVAGCRAGMVPPGSSQEQLLYAKKLYDSAFHPDSGEKMNLIGRMSFQVPGGMAITGFMLQFYRTVPAVVFWQWVNQSFNAIVNYTNRNAASPISLAVLFYISMHLLQITRQIGVAYVTATTTALATAVGLNLYTKRAPPLLARWVPFAAVAAANCVNIPMMRQQEIIRGISVTDEDNNELGHSRRAAVKGIAQVVVSRITMAAPGMSECGMRMGTRSILQLSAWPVLMELRGLVGSLTLLPSCSHSAHHHGASGEASLHAADPGSPCAAAGAAVWWVPAVHGAGSLCPVPSEMLPCAG
ncbi:sideroflexin-2 isoform X1 [Gallus gallus]|uniref:sideroflexin-2 isoform X1 n=1 Tax=Gallus gallus TaxID=9031 RepID=UPI001AE35762|nr:sideroflexin-2 isoform X1 [Gallus gallus]XP_015144230.2 sideroflexin-2 isoform X1 [Gallus gallus]XP_040531140.1 sideroflexin-2 isoform X1 [Gallus gallus]XP_040531141.1 sideroflexin-2 isoform X1 [Gallus gallus]XP_046776729.1 sideroflexin-2 isoform X1 [Gallus gallus]XP_046799258.1 sideroflexin-2 isoform X1 [Gallus gallus]